MRTLGQAFIPLPFHAPGLRRREAGEGTAESMCEGAVERENPAQRWRLDDAEAAEAPKPRPGRRLLSSSLVGSANRGRVLQALFDLGPTSRAALARHAGVNRTTISGIVQPLLDQQLLVEGEPVPASDAGGKPARPLWFSRDARP